MAPYNQIMVIHSIKLTDTPIFFFHENGSVTLIFRCVSMTDSFVETVVLSHSETELHLSLQDKAHMI